MSWLFGFDDPRGSLNWGLIFVFLLRSDYDADLENPTLACMHKQIAFSVRDKCLKHWIGDKSIFDDYQPCHTNLIIRKFDRSLSKVDGIGLVQLSPEITLKYVLHVPKLDSNLIFISKLTRDNHLFY